MTDMPSRVVERLRADRERLTGQSAQPERSARKIKRDAFLYYSNPEKIRDFAQCSSCIEYDKANRVCVILSKRDVAPNDTCGFYLKGEYDGRRQARLIGVEESDYLARTQVRCENCFYGGARCGLYVLLNNELPRFFDLKEEIEPLACCNAWTPK
jgi:hypothetical protein